jgi:hypothetical protein
MKWNNMQEIPSIKNREKFLGEWLILLGTDGNEVAPFLFHSEMVEYKIIGKLKKITHWMYPEEVFSPSKMLKLIDIIKSNG